MKVLLVNPWQPIHDTTRASFGVAWPLGLLYLATATRAAGHDVTVLDMAVGGNSAWVHHGAVRMTRASGFPPDEHDVLLIGMPLGALASAIIEIEPDVIGLSLPFSSQHRYIPRIIEALKTHAPNALIIAGGTHTTLAADLVLDFDGINYVVAGEGEVVFPKLLSRIENGESPAGLPGICYKDGNTRVISPFEIISDIDDIGLPAFDLVPKYQYFFGINGATYFMFSSRGCPFNCRFCSAPFLTHRKWRPHSVERVLSEIDQLLSEGAEEIRFVDDNASADTDRFKSIMEGIIRAGWKVRLSACSFHCTTLDRETLMLMRLAGFQRVMFAPESGNDRVLREEIGKTITVAQSENLVRSIVAAGMIPDLNIMIGMPGESWAEIQDTVVFCHRMKELGAGGAWVSCATPMLGTALYQEVVDKGMFPGGVPDLFSYAVATYDGIDWTREQLTETWRMLDRLMNGETR